MSDSGAGSGGTGGNPPAGWYPAGEGAGHRWWDGSTWTEHTGGAPGDPAPGGAGGVGGAGSGDGSPAAYEEATRVRPSPLDSSGTPGSSGSSGDGGAGAGGFAAAPTGYPAGPSQSNPYGQPGQPGQSGQSGQFGGPGQPGQFGQPGYGAPPPAGKKGPSKVLLGAIGGGVLLVIIVIVLLVVFLGGNGGGGGGDNPQQVAEDFAGALSDGDLSAACELVDEDSRDELLGDADAGSCDDVQLSDVPGFSDLPEDVGVSFEVGKVTEDGDTATGPVEIGATYEGDDEALKSQIEDAPTTDGEIELSREDGGWVVSDFN